ncbi:LysM peptidoglycan-binding domain-containing protein, partial [Staphylococcus hominis]
DIFGQKNDEGKTGAGYVDTTKPATPGDIFGQKNDEGKTGAGYVDTTKPATPGDIFGQKNDEGKTGAHYVDNTTDETTTHTVVPGETVAEIAKENNTTVDQIVKDNGLVDANHIVPGQELLVNHPVTNTEDLTQTTTHNNNFTTSQDVVDNKELPETGSESNVNSGLLGGLALAAGAVLVGFNRRKEEK